MPDGYRCKIDQCDVPAERRPQLERFRAKRLVWLSWLETDEHHAIWTVLFEMVWKEVGFRALSNLAGDDANALNNPLLAEALLDGHVATQVLAIRRLMDDSGSGVISLRRLLKDVKANKGLFTRENYVCFDGLPYDYRAVRDAQLQKHLKEGVTFFWGAMEGPEADGTSELAHMQFDKLAGVDAEKRSREDRPPARLFDTIEGWLAASGADDLAKWSSTYLAHAGGPERREQIKSLTVTANKIENAIKVLSRAAEAMSAWLLNAGGRSAALMPVAQFDPFEKLDKPVMQVGGEEAANNHWRSLSAEWNRCLDGVQNDLIGSSHAPPSQSGKP